MQLPLAKGDAAFFNPALFHGAGTNVSADIQRMANLLQVSSAFGRAMETVDRDRVVPRGLPGAAATRPRRATRPRSTTRSRPSAEGYPFPTNLDLDQPVDGLTPPSMAEIVTELLARGAPADELGEPARRVHRAAGNRLGPRLTAVRRPWLPRRASRSRSSPRIGGTP